VRRGEERRGGKETEGRKQTHVPGRQRFESHTDRHGGAVDSADKEAFYKK
jgi:hypothetical protein